MQGFIIGALYKDKDYFVYVDRTFYGYPTKLNVYIAGDDDQFKLHTVFSGTPSGSSNSCYQFIFYESVQCKKVHLEFYDVTVDQSGIKTAAVSEIKLFQDINDDSLSIEEAKGEYANHEIVTSKTIDVLSYSSSGDKGTNKISNAFDNKKTTYWFAEKASDDSFHSYIIVNFTETVTLEAFLYGAVYTTYFGDPDQMLGFPLKLNVYTANDEDDFTLAAKFAGVANEAYETAQFVFKDPVKCSRIKLEFVDVTTNTKVSGNPKSAAVSELIFLKTLEYAYLAYSKVTGFDDSHKIPSSKFVPESSDSKSNYPLSNAFNGKASSFWISENANSDTFTNYITVNFTEPVLFEGFILGSYYTTGWGTTYGYGFPTKLNVYAYVSDDEPLQKIATFIGSSPSEDYYQFQLKNPISCSQIKLEFAEVYTSRSFYSSQKIAALSEVILLGQIIKLPGNDDDEDKDYSAQLVNKNYPLNYVRDTNFYDFTLPLGEDYLFIIEKKFEFENDQFAPRTRLSAIKNNNTNKVTVKKCSFTNCSVRRENGNGGAILSINSGLSCETSTFLNCSSKTGGGGGALFIVLRENVEEQLIISSCTFRSCVALFGSGIYVFSQMETNCIKIEKCLFVSNELLPTKENALTGGCAIYLHAKRAITRRCKF